MTVADKLPERLRAHVAGLTTPSAAVDLLVPHCTWLRRRGFLDEFTFSTADFDTGTTTTGMEWAEAVAPWTTAEPPLDAQTVRRSEPFYYRRTRPARMTSQPNGKDLGRHLPVDLGLEAPKG